MDDDVPKNFSRESSPQSEKGTLIDGKIVSQMATRDFIWRDESVFLRGLPLRSQCPAFPSLSNFNLGACSRSTSVDESPTLLFDEQLPVLVWQFSIASREIKVCDKRLYCMEVDSGEGDMKERDRRQGGSRVALETNNTMMASSKYKR